MRVEDAPVSHRRSETRHKSETITVRVTPAEKAEIAAFAAAHGSTLSEVLLLCFTAQQYVEATQEAVRQ